MHGDVDTTNMEATGVVDMEIPENNDISEVVSEEATAEEKTMSRDREDKSKTTPRTVETTEIKDDDDETRRNTESDDDVSQLKEDELKMVQSNHRQENPSEKEENLIDTWTIKCTVRMHYLTIQIYML